MNADYAKLAKLVPRLQAGEDQAFTTLYELTNREFHFFAFSILKNETDAQDAVQDTYIKILSSIHTLENHMLFIAWAKQILYHICLRILEKKKDIPAEHMVFYCDAAAWKNGDPLIMLVEMEKKNIIMNYIQTLNPILSKTLILKYYENLKINEISLIMNCPEGTVKSRLSTAKRQLRYRILHHEKDKYIS